jgi:hypothetical protein
MSRRTWYTVGGAVVAVLFFQLFIHYQYIHLAGGDVMRIDRLTGSSCHMPCLPTPSPTPAPPPTPVPTPPPKPPQNYTLEDARAIEQVKDRGAGVSGIVYRHSQDSEWLVAGRYDNEGTPQGYPYYSGQHRTPNPSYDNTHAYPVRLVCYCLATKKMGWYWEYHLDTGEVFTVTGNRTLELVYGFPPPTTPP